MPMPLSSTVIEMGAFCGGRREPPRPNTHCAVRRRILDGVGELEMPYSQTISFAETKAFRSVFSASLRALMLI